MTNIFYMIIPAKITSRNHSPLSRRIFYKASFVIFFLLLSFQSCKKNTVTDLIPNVPVNFTVYLSLPQYSSLNSIGNYAIVDNVGYRGVIVYRRALTEFVAFDLACPYDPSTGKLSVDSSGVTLYHSTCGSKFSLYDGSKIAGPATRTMKPYNAEYSANDNAVYVYN
jgi:hypothetical protein